jgi:hypothetical protein
MLIKSNPATEALHKFWEQQIQKEFANIDFSHCSDYLCLIHYIEKSPQKFYSRKAFNLYLDFLLSMKAKKPKLLVEILKEAETLFSIANKILADINLKPIHDIHMPTDNNDLINFIDKEIHYNLLKVYETPLYQFAHLIAKYSWISNGKKTDGLDLYNSVEELKKLGFDFLNDVYLHDVRNGIAHGKIVFSDYKIAYFDKKGNVAKVAPRDIIKAFDGILDITNGFCLAFKLFCFTNVDFFERHKLRIPQSILLEELQAKANGPGWQITNCLESQASNKRQLMIYAKNDNWDFAKVNWYCFATAYWAEMLITSYERIFFSLHSTSSKYASGWAAYNAVKLKELREKKEMRFEAYKGVLEGDLLFFVPKFRFPRVIYKLGTIKSVYSVLLPLLTRQFIDELFPNPYFARDAKMHSKGTFNVVQDPSVILKRDFQTDIQNLIRKDKAKIVGVAIKFARKANRSLLLSVLSVKNIRVFIYESDMRVRQLRNSGLIPELIATIEVNTTKHIRTIDINGGVPEQHGKYRIVWNKKWLLNNGDTGHDPFCLPLKISIESMGIVLE